MNGEPLILQVRRYLRDIETDVDKGTFWDDREIILALNVSQDVVVNHLIDNKQYQALNRLVSAYLYNPDSPVSFWRNLPSDYLHFFSAQTGSVDTLVTSTVHSPNPVFASPVTSKLEFGVTTISPDDTSKLKTAKVYLGGESAPFLFTYHQAVFIVGNLIGAQGDNIFYNQISGGESYPPFILHYYRRPSKIWLTKYGHPTIINQPITLADISEESFDTDVYNTICQHAAVILSFKETQTQRDVKTAGAVATKLGSLIAKSSLYLRDQDITVIQQRGQNNSGNQQ